METSVLRCNYAMVKIRFTIYRGASRFRSRRTAIKSAPGRYWGAFRPPPASGQKTSKASLAAIAVSTAMTSNPTMAPAIRPAVGNATCATWRAWRHAWAGMDGILGHPFVPMAVHQDLSLDHNIMITCLLPTTPSLPPASCPCHAFFCLPPHACTYLSFLFLPLLPASPSCILCLLPSLGIRSGSLSGFYSCFGSWIVCRRPVALNPYISASTMVAVPNHPANREVHLFYSSTSSTHLRQLDG